MKVEQQLVGADVISKVKAEAMALEAYFEECALDPIALCRQVRK